MGIHRHKIITTPFLPLLVFLVSMWMKCYEFQFVSAGETIMCVDREREALLTFKESLKDDYDILSSWQNEDHKKECCEWEGVTCSNTTGHVIVLQLVSLQGEISPILLELHHLNELYLSDNNFGGKKIPKFIGSIKSLQHLDFSYSSLSGNIPPELGNLTNLRTLYLDGNNLWSDNLHWLSRLSLLSELGLGSTNVSDTNWLQHVVLQLPSLQKLYLRDRKITDVTSSANLSSSASLSTLSLANNQLASSIFEWLFNISTSLVYVDVSNNELDGPIPDVFGELVFLERLDLSGNMLKGGVPKSLGNLIRLQSLDVSRNDLGEPLVELFGNLSCKIMARLYLSNNEFTGFLPDLRKCHHLVALDLSNNKLSGTVPTSLGQLSNLQLLDLSQNSFHGAISYAHFVKLQNLTTLDLSFNSLTLDLSPDWIFPSQLEDIRIARCKVGPSFPTWLQTLQSTLSWIDLSSNGISDEVPKWFWSTFNVMMYLNLSRNHISGTIPDLSSNFINVIDVSSNMFSGPLPLPSPRTTVFQLNQNMFSGSITSLCSVNCSDLRLLDLSNNQLAGKLPNSWENMTMLEVLNLNNNNLASEIPYSLGFLRNLKTLHLGGNNFIGNLPSTLKNCRLLQLIDVGGNKLTGNIPPWLGESCTDMMYLTLRRNGFHGGIPREICRLNQIQMLDLSENNISGKIPPCFNNFTSLVQRINKTTTTAIRIPVGYNDYILYTFVQWKGQESEYKNTLGLLKLIDLSSNKLVGSIPKEFSNLRGLISLNLSRNSLTGNLDPNIGGIEMLESLDLSRNQPSGEIPISLAQLHYPSVLDLASNNFSGKIPSSTQLQSFDESAFGRNSDLCGKPLKLCSSDDPITSAGEDNKEENDGFFSLSFMQEFGISMAFGFIVGFWGAVGSLLLKKSWRSAYFSAFDAIGDWLYVTTTIFLNKFRQS